jgi:hypothetical protein
MKRIIITIACFAFMFITKAQEVEGESKAFFKKQNLFAGGSAGGGFGNGSFSVGLGPHIGYSLNNYVDVALSLNYNYYSQRDYQLLGDKLRLSVVGPGAFVRVFPVDFIFVQGQVERNFLTQKYIPPTNSSLLREKRSIAANSLLVGGGYASGRQAGSGNFYYFSVLFDIGKDINSPYIDGLGRIDPLIRAGFNFTLFGGNDGGGRDGRRSRRDDF